MSINWNDYPNFSKWEFDCSHTEYNDMQPEFMNVLQRIRTRYNKPIRISSGYRHWSHPIEAEKGHRLGEHVQGRCADIAIDRGDAFTVLKIALEEGILRVGVNQKGNGRFLHLGLGGDNLLTPTIWSY